MTYTPKPGDIGLVKMPGTVGRLIRFGQWLNGEGYFDYEHAFVVVDDQMIVEAMPGGAAHTPLAVYEPLEPVYLRSPDISAQLVAAAAMGLVGTPYSALDYFSLAAKRWHVPAPRLQKYVTSTKHMICSQLADYAAELGTWYLFSDNRWPGYVTPASLYALYEKQSAQGRP